MAIEAIGGTISTITVGDVEYTVHTFTSSGTFEVQSGDGTIEYLVVAGGGGAGINGGGGGGGGFLTGSTTVSTTNYAITVGAGGAGAQSTPNHKYGYDGGNSSIVGTGVSITATGGGGGGTGAATADMDGRPGGSGGGGGKWYSYVAGMGGSGTSGQGYAGGDGLQTNSYGGGGGGGGAGQVGYTGNSNTLTNRGNGGDGLPSSISGSENYYGGGGAGFFTSPTTQGGLGGGGAKGQSGSTNTGGGGGAYSTVAGCGSGGSGIVIIRYETTPVIDAYFREEASPCGEFSVLANDILPHSDARYAAAAPLWEPSFVIDSGVGPTTARFSEPLIPCGELSVVVGVPVRSWLSASIDTLLPFRVVAGTLELPTTPGDCDSAYVWYGFDTDSTDVIIPLVALTGIDSAALDPTTGDWREVLYRILLKASNYYAGLPEDLQSSTGRIVTFDTYRPNHPRFGEVIQRRVVFNVNVNVDEQTVADE